MRFIRNHAAALQYLFLHGRHIHGSNFCVRIRRCFRSDTTGVAERHNDWLHANRLEPDRARAAGHGNQRTVYALWHQDTMRKLQWLVLDEDVSITYPGMRGVVFVDTSQPESLACCLKAGYRRKMFWICRRVPAPSSSTIGAAT